ncbi:MAG TPA: DUF2500 domain-containing protein [Firmicutes bacterium]|nr:DUF2500 domain-containing protein [Bacillota bacterium]
MFFGGSGDPFIDVMFTIVPLLIIAGFIFVISMFIKQGVEYAQDKAKPIESVQAKVIAKRTNVSRHHHDNGHMHDSSSTSYYVTFEFYGGDRLELLVPGKKFGYMIEGDEGTLQYQGRIFVGFERRL